VKIGGPEPGDGINEFSYPYAVTAMSISDDEAFTYVADRGNNRIVLLYLRIDYQGEDPVWSLQWKNTMELPSDLQSNNTLPVAGLEDIEVDDFLYNWNGVWVLDTRNSDVIQIDYYLESIIQKYDGFQHVASEPHDLAVHKGEMGIINPYTQNSGLEKFELKSSILNVEVNPNPFVYPLEWAMVTLTVSGKGRLEAWILESIPFLVEILCDSSLIRRPSHPLSNQHRYSNLS